jgi:hypothetical protein
VAVPAAAIPSSSTATTASTPGPAPVAATESATAPATAPASTPPPKLKLGRLTIERLDAGRIWLDQLIETLLRRVSSSKVDLENIHVYYSELSGKPRFGVTYGDYASAAAASASIRELPKALRASKPYPRQVVRLR